MGKKKKEREIHLLRNTKLDREVASNHQDKMTSRLHIQFSD